MNPSPSEVAALVVEATAKGESVYAAVVTAASDPSLVGRRWWTSGNRQGGSLGNPSLDRRVARALREPPMGMRSAAALSRDFAYRDEGGDGTATVYVEAHAPPPALVVVGAGHIAVPLCGIGAMLGFRVVVLDDREEYATRERFSDAATVRVIDFRDPFAETPLAPRDHIVLVTRGHRFDYECLVRVLRMPETPRYIGVIGSRRRVRATHAKLIGDGIDVDRLRRVRAPVGLDLGGQSPAEIALAIAAEIVMLRARATGTPLTEKECIVERFFAQPRRPKGQ